jgi:hypothetical protein
MAVKTAAPSAAAANRADRGVEDRAERSRPRMDAKLRHQQPANERACDADRQIADEAPRPGRSGSPAIPPST